MELRIPPVIQVTLAMSLMLAIWFVESDAAIPMPWLCAVFALTAVLFLVEPVSTFVRSRTTVDPIHPDRAEQLISSGLYRVSRNPMYVGMVLALCAAAAAMFVWQHLVVITAFVAWMTRFQIIPEERALERRFGEQYLDYKRRVRRWL